MTLDSEVLVSLTLLLSSSVAVADPRRLTRHEAWACGIECVATGSADVRPNAARSLPQRRGMGQRRGLTCPRPHVQARAGLPADSNPRVPPTAEQGLSQNSCPL